MGSFSPSQHPKQQSAATGRAKDRVGARRVRIDMGSSLDGFVKAVTGSGSMEKDNPGAAGGKGRRGGFFPDRPGSFTDRGGSAAERRGAAGSLQVTGRPGPPARRSAPAEGSQQALHDHVVLAFVEQQEA